MSSAASAHGSVTPHVHRQLTTILLVAPSAPPYGGMQLQAELLARMLRADGFRVVPVATNPPFPQSAAVFERLRGIRPLLRAVMFCIRLWHHVAGTDVVHVLAASWLYFFIVVYPAVVLGRLRRKRVVLTYHGGEAERFLKFWATLARPAFRMAHAVTAPSGFLKQVIERRARVPVTIVPNVVDLSAFRYRARRDLGPKMLVTRHLEKMYDIAAVLRAFSRVQACHAGASLAVAGTGSEAAYLRSLASELNLRNIRFLGSVAYENLPSLYDQCDIFLNASRVDNFPGALLEASASGLVVITKRAGGIPFLYQDRKNALLVEVGDSAGLAVAVENALEDPALAASLMERGVELAKQFEWRNVRPTLLEVYGCERNREQESAAESFRTGV